MFIMMDANIFISDFNLESKSFSELRSHSERLGIKLFCSSVVFDEVVQKYKEKIIEYNQKNKVFMPLIPSTYLKLVPNEAIDEMIGIFRSELRRKLRINSFGTRFVELDFLNRDSYLSVYEKALYKLKPFNIAGKGYKDALIWEQILWIVNTYCDDNKKLAFITNNIEDFSEKIISEKGWFFPAPHLIEQYKKNGFPEDTVRIYQSLKALNLEVIYNKLDNYNKYIEYLNTELNEGLKNFILSQLSLNELDLSVGKLMCIQ